MQRQRTNKRATPKLLHPQLPPTKDTASLGQDGMAPCRQRSRAGAWQDFKVFCAETSNARSPQAEPKDLQRPEALLFKLDSILKWVSRFGVLAYHLFRCGLHALDNMPKK